MRRTSLTMIHELARRDRRVLYIGSDPGPGTLAAMAKELPEQFFIEGIAEANLIGMAAGLAMDGYIPYVNTIATFLTRRCFEQVAVDLCLHDLPVRLMANGGGGVYAPLGPTHAAIEDIALMRHLPNMTVVCPADADEMRRFMNVSLDWPHPIYVRLAKGGDPIVSRESDGFTIGKAIVHKMPGDVVIVTTGITLQVGLRTVELLAQRGVSCGIIHMPTVKPFDAETLLDAATHARLVVTLEEHLRTGGLGSAVSEMFVDRTGRTPSMLCLGFPDAFVDFYGSQEGWLKHFGLEPEAVSKAVLGRLKNSLALVGRPH